MYATTLGLAMLTRKNVDPAVVHIYTTGHAIAQNEDKKEVLPVAATKY